jgi:hypothetical protein
MKNGVNPLVVAGGLAAAYFLFIKPTVPATPSTVPLSTVPPAGTTTEPLTSYPYLINGAPLPMPSVFNQAYYLTYIYPAMIAQNSNVSNPAYTLSQTDAINYLANYTDVSQWANNASAQGGGRHDTPYQAAVYHWHTYGVPEQRTFLPLPWTNPAQWVPAPVKTGSSVFGDVLKGLTVVGAGVLEVASAGTLTPVVAPTAALALSAESSIKGTCPVPSDDELQILFTGAWVLTNILPYYNQTNKKVVKQINNTLHSLLNQYA